MADSTETTKTKKANGGSKVISCKCANTFQDGKYGLGQRVHNYCEKGLRCTVCGNIVMISRG